MFNFYFSLNGRVGRLQWWFGSLPILAVLFISVLLIHTLFGGLVGESIENTREDLDAVQWVFRYVLWAMILIMWALLIWVQVSLTVKRYHDRDMSGWWFFIAFIPLVWFWQIIECGFFPGTPGGNSYGQRTLHSGNLNTEISGMREARSKRLGMTQPTFRENAKKPSQPARSKSGHRNGFGRRGQEA